jgi:hypothetical protein
MFLVLYLFISCHYSVSLSFALVIVTVSGVYLYYGIEILLAVFQQDVLINFFIIYIIVSTFTLYGTANLTTARKYARFYYKLYIFSNTYVVTGR